MRDRGLRRGPSAFAVLAFVLVAAAAGPGTTAAGAAPAADEYELLIPGPDGEGETPHGRVEISEPDALPGESTSGAPPELDSTAVEEPTDRGDELANGRRATRRVEAALRGPTYTLAPIEPAGPELASTRASDDGISMSLIALAAVALFIAGIGVWRQRRARGLARVES